MLRCRRSEQQRTRTEATDADTAILVLVTTSCSRAAARAQNGRYMPVLAATADWRVPRPCVRQSAAESRHQVVPARGACNSSTAPGRWCCDRALSSSSSGSAQGPKPPTQTRGHPRSRQYRRSQPRRRSVLSRLGQPHFESTLAVAGRPASKLQPVRCSRLHHLLTSSRRSRSGGVRSFRGWVSRISSRPWQ